MQFLTSENIMYGTRWLCFKTDKKNLIRLTWCWKGRCHYWKIAKLPRRQLFFYIFQLKHSWRYRRTWGPSRIIGYVDLWQYICVHVYMSPVPGPPHPPPPPPMVSPPTPNPATPQKPSICMLFAHIHTHIHIYTPLSTPPTSHLYVICSTWEPRPRQRTLSTCTSLS